MKTLAPMILPSALVCMGLFYSPTSVAIAQTIENETFVSFNGKFKIEYPSNWMRVDYRTVDFHLQQSADVTELLQYEAVFTPDTSGLFYNREYLLLTVDTTGELSRRQIDSVLADMSASFEIDPVREPITNFAGNLRAGMFKYDDKQQVAAVATEVFDGGQVTKISLLVVKFYETGSANFYFFAPVASYQDQAETFQRIVSSFSTSNLRTVSNQPVPVTELDSGGDGATGLVFWLSLAVALVALIMIFVLRRKSRTA